MSLHTTLLGHKVTFRLGDEIQGTVISVYEDNNNIRYQVYSKDTKKVYDITFTQICGIDYLDNTQVRK